jgi:hypothetical protein
VTRVLRLLSLYLFRVTACLTGYPATLQGGGICLCAVRDLTGWPCLVCDEWLWVLSDRSVACAEDFNPRSFSCVLLVVCFVGLACVTAAAFSLCMLVHSALCPMTGHHNSCIQTTQMFWVAAPSLLWWRPSVFWAIGTAAAVPAHMCGRWFLFGSLPAFCGRVASAGAPYLSVSRAA